MLEGCFAPVVGLILVAAVAWLFARMSRAEKRLAVLERALEAAGERERAAAAPPPPRPRVAAAAPDAPPAVLEPGAPVSERAEAGVPHAVVSPPMPQRPVATSAGDGASAADTGAPAPVSAISRWLFGGNTIVKVGIGVLFIGLAFLAKFASERVHVPIEVRLSTIGGAALVLLALGWRLRERRPGYAQVLQGGAVAVLYLTLFVAFRFYGVLGVGPVFILMAAVAVLSAALAVLQDAPALAVIGALGGFATPLLVSTGQGSHVALFSYYLLLDLGIAAVAWHRTWKPLNLVGFFFTFVVATAWGVLKYEDAHYASCQAFLAAFFLVFAAIMLMPARRRQAGAGGSTEETWVNGTLLFGLPTITFVLQYGLVRHTSYGVALSALAMAAFYVALAAWMRSRPRFVALIFEGSLAVGAIFVTLTIPFALDARSTAGAWALEGAALVWLGFRQRRILGRLAGYLLLLVSGLTLFVNSALDVARESVLNATLFNGLLVAAASLAGAWLVGRFTRDAQPESRTALPAERVAEPSLVAWATIWLVFCAWAEIDAYVESPHELTAWLASLSAMALVFTGLSSWLRWRVAAAPAVLFAPVLLLLSLVELGSGSPPTAGGGWWAWPIALAVHVAVLRRAAPEWSEGWRQAAHLLGVLVLAILGSLEGRDITARWGDLRTAWAWLGWLAVPAGLLILLPGGAAARAWPVSASPRTYRTVASGLLAFGAVLWTLFANVVSDGTASPLPYIPVLNPLDLGVGVALVAAWRWREGEGGRAAGREVSAAMLALLGGGAFVWLNAILIRAFHHLLGVAFYVDAWMASLAVQTGISLLWSIIALGLMWWATRRVVRAPWMIGALLLGAVVLKLLAVDLSGTGTVTRIISFIGVGVLMLVIGYVAPLPAKEGSDAAR